MVKKLRIREGIIGVFFFLRQGHCQPPKTPNIVIEKIGLIKKKDDGDYREDVALFTPQNNPFDILRRT